MIFSALILMAYLSSAPHNFDCGERAKYSLIYKTKSLVIHSVPIELPVSEASMEDKGLECVRVKFSIDSSGRPVDVVIAESTKDIGVEIAAVRAVKKYRFRSELFSQFKTYSLVFSVKSRYVP